MREIILTYLPYVLIPCAWVLSRIIYQPLPKDVDRLKNLDALEERLTSMKWDLDADRENLARRLREIQEIQREAERTVAESSRDVQKYKNIAEKANKERHGAVERFRRKLKKYEET